MISHPCAVDLVKSGLLHLFAHELLSFRMRFLVVCLSSFLLACTSAHGPEKGAATEPTAGRGGAASGGGETALGDVLRAGEVAAVQQEAAHELPEPCSDAWFARVEATHPVSDRDGHGPDVGSHEWMRALIYQRHLEERVVSELGSAAWCEEVDRALYTR